MKKTRITALIAVGLLTAGAQAQQVLLMGQTVFDNVDTNGVNSFSAVYETPGNHVGVSINQSTVTNAIGNTAAAPGFSCNDVHYGPDIPTNTTDEGVVEANAYRINNGEYVEWTLTNTSGSNIEIQAIRFDAMCRWKNNLPDIDVYYIDGDLPATPMNVLASVATVQRAVNDDIPQNMTDYEVDLTSIMPVTVLEDGQSATFALVGHAGNATVIDNVGFFGEVGVPLPTNYPPVFDISPITVITGMVGEAVSGSLSNLVSDWDGDTVTYGKVSGDSWLSVDPVSGVLGGTPTSTNAGWNIFVVSASDGTYTNESSLIMPVLTPEEEALNLVGWTAQFNWSADVKDHGGMKAAVLDYSKRSLKQSSEDETWGDILMTPFPNELDHAYAATNTVSYKFSVTNQTPWDVRLEDVLFDYSRFGKGPKDISITTWMNSDTPVALGGVTNLFQTLTGHQFAFTNAWGDTTLLRGDSLVVQMDFSNGTQNNIEGFVDNIAIRYETLAFSDRDSDGIPDFWEDNTWTNGLYNPDATSDYDLDGTSDKSEYFANTDPLDPESLLRFESITPLGGGGFEISWQSASNRTYNLFTKDNLASGSWIPTEHTNVVSAAPSNNTVTVSDAPIAFFRVQVEMVE